jgi:hypothetical protein
MTFEGQICCSSVNILQKELSTLVDIRQQKIPCFVIFFSNENLKNKFIFITKYC